MGKSLEIAKSDNWLTHEAAACYLRQKSALFFAFFYKTRANAQQVLPVHRRSQDFWLGGAQTTNHMQLRHQKFSKKELFVEQKYRIMEDLKP